MEITNKINTTSLYHGKAVKNIIIELVDEVLYSDSMIINETILNSWNMQESEVS